MLITAVSFFTLAVILGMSLLSYVLRRKNTPKGLAFTHGGLAGVGITLLIIYSFYHTPTPMESLALLIIAAMGGFVLIYKDLTGKPIPKLFAIGHGIIAISGLILLCFFSLKSMGYL
jgi:hypothetical protein